MGVPYYHQDNPEVFYECFKEEAKDLVKMMTILDSAIICSNLPPFDNSKLLLEAVMEMRYIVDQRYKKRNNIPDDGFDYLISHVEKDNLLSEMKTLLIEELNKVFPPTKQNDD